MALSTFEKFSGVYCSGSFIKNASAVTALALLFEDLYIPNNLALALEFAKHYRFTRLPQKIQDDAMGMTFKPDDPLAPDPLSGLSESQQLVIKQYYMITQQFFLQYRELIGSFIKTDIFHNQNMINVELVKQGKPGEQNTYKVSLSPLNVYLLDNNEYDPMENMLSQGAIPIICDETAKLYRAPHPTDPKDINARALACILAMKSIELVIPSTKPADSETILEARDRLKDFLPPFWSAMLKLSKDLRNRISENMPTEQLLFEGQEIVDTTVLPALIELKEKILKEQKNWFYKIMSPIAGGIKLLIGNSQLTYDGLIRAGLYSSFDIIGGAYSQKRAVDSIKQESGLTFLLKADKILANSKN